MAVNRNQTGPTAEHLFTGTKKSNKTSSVPEVDLEDVNGSNGQSACHKLPQWMGYACNFEV